MAHNGLNLPLERNHGEKDRLFQGCLRIGKSNILAVEFHLHPFFPVCTCREGLRFDGTESVERQGKELSVIGTEVVDRSVLLDLWRTAFPLERIEVIEPRLSIGLCDRKT